MIFLAQDIPDEIGVFLGFFQAFLADCLLVFDYFLHFAEFVWRIGVLPSRLASWLFWLLVSRYFSLHFDRRIPPGYLLIDDLTVFLQAKSLVVVDWQHNHSAAHHFIKLHSELLKEWEVQGLLCCQSLAWIEHHQLTNQLQKLFWNWWKQLLGVLFLERCLINELFCNIVFQWTHVLPRRIACKCQDLFQLIQSRRS